MPTGYTADIKNGITFKRFAMNCSRAFGALVMMRDDPADAPIPKSFKPSNYHKDRLAEAKSELSRLQKMSSVTAELAAEREYQESERRRLSALKETRKLRDKYTAMLAKTRAWKPPTKDHEGLKELMIEQIESSIDFDCDEKYWEKASVRQTGPGWLSAKIDKVKRDIAYHTEEYEKECKWAKERTAWVSTLRKSLK